MGCTTPNLCDLHSDVQVIDDGASVRKPLLGGLLGELAVGNGWSGLLVNGGVRDVEALAGLPPGVRALADTPMKTERRGQGEVGVPVNFAGVDFKRGHWLYADANGVIVSATELSPP